jgi:alpha-L-fucosidase 2
MAAPSDGNRFIARNDVIWMTLGTNENNSMPIGNGDVELHSGNNFTRIWVDANHPVVHVQVQTGAPVQVKSTSEVWRTKEYSLDTRAIDRTGLGFFEWGGYPNSLTFYPDIILPSKDNRVSSCHFNTHSIYPMVFREEHLESLLPKFPDPLMHRCFGLTVLPRTILHFRLLI